MMPDPFNVLLFILAVLLFNAAEGIALGCYRGLRDAWHYHRQKEV